METGDCESGGGLLCTAYEQHVSSPSSLEMVGWLDSDGDGVFDLLDVPHLLDGTGHYDAETGLFHFVGDSAVQTLPNRNSSGLGNDITLNVISRAEFRVDEGPWQTAATYGTSVATIDLSIPLPEGTERIEIRTIDDQTDVSSPIFVGHTSRPSSTLQPGIQGLVWSDGDGNGLWDSGETGVADWQVDLVDANGQLLDLQDVIEPDDYPNPGTVLNLIVPVAELRAIGAHAGSGAVTTTLSSDASTGTRIFASLNGACGGTCSEWSPDRQLRIEFAQPATMVSLDAIGTRPGSRGRIDLFDVSGQLVGRATTGDLGDGGVESLVWGSDGAGIASAVAFGHAESTVLFDNLRIGTDATALTDQFGFYAFPFLDTGEYSIRPQAAGAMQPTQPSSGIQSVALQIGQVIDGVDFGFRAANSPWRNAEPFDVNNDGFVSPVDVLQIINDLNSHGARQLTDEATPPFLDVNGDFNVTSQDILLIINQLNAASPQGEAPAEPSLNQDNDSGSDYLAAEGEFAGPEQGADLGRSERPSVTDAGNHGWGESGALASRENQLGSGRNLLRRSVPLESSAVDELLGDAAAEWWLNSVDSPGPGFGP
jgi:hypothetical protein